LIVSKESYSVISSEASMIHTQQIPPVKGTSELHVWGPRKVGSHEHVPFCMSNLKAHRAINDVKDSMQSFSTSLTEKSFARKKDNVDIFRRRGSAVACWMP
jgi:hypothetical protein